MSTPRLKTKLWVQAQVMLCNGLAIPIAVTKKGHEDAGVVFLKINRGAAGCEVLSQSRSLDGALVWFRATGPEPVSEADADALIEREKAFDPDFWVLEIEDPNGLYEPDAPVLER